MPKDDIQQEKRRSLLLLVHTDFETFEMNAAFHLNAVLDQVASHTTQDIITH